jgi:phospholipid-binding lipoprotein MlaA
MARATPCSFVVVVTVMASGLFFSNVSAKAGALPRDIEATLEVAAMTGREEMKRGTEMRGTPHPTRNARLEAAVMKAINARPDLIVPIVETAILADPERKRALIKRVAASYPSVEPLVSGRSAPHMVADGLEAESIVYLSSNFDDPPWLEPNKRPPNWPILPEEGGPDGYAEIDPLAPINEAIFYFNGAVDYLLFEPISKVYAAIMPDVAEEAFGRAFNNLGEPITFINDILQFDLENAGTTLARFVINSTIGILGLFDVAKEFGLERHKADFGQTLHRYGFGDGIYIVMPIFGPSTVRDAIGFFADFLVDPRQLVFESEAAVLIAPGELVVRRSEVFEPADFIEIYAEDPYTAVRAWTWQQRTRFLKAECDKPTVIVCPPFEEPSKSN